MVAPSAAAGRLHWDGDWEYIAVERGQEGGLGLGGVRGSHPTSQQLKSTYRHSFLQGGVSK